VANLGVDVCAAAELVKPAQVSAISMAKVVMGTKGPLRTKYLLILGLIGLDGGQVYLWLFSWLGDGIPGAGASQSQHNVFFRPS
jgi:hypothetical protein